MRNLKNRVCVLTGASRGLGPYMAHSLAAEGVEELRNGSSPQAAIHTGYERAFGTIQGRLPQELRVAGIPDYASANKYLERIFVADFNRRFPIKPTESGSAFVPLVGIYEPRGGDVQALQGSDRRNVYLQAVVLYNF